ncbi:hypothetical protein Q5752_005270 [Cryptotrichosporon argae]
MMFDLSNFEAKHPSGQCQRVLQDVLDEIHRQRAEHLDVVTLQTDAGEEDWGIEPVEEINTAVEKTPEEISGLM